MKKKLIALFITFILLFSVGVSTVYAAKTESFNIAILGTGNTGTFKRYRWNPTTSTMKSKGWITSDWYAASNKVSLCANDPNLYDEIDGKTNSNKNACRPQKEFWNLYQVKVGSKYYIVYCVNPHYGIDHDSSVWEDTTLENMTFQDTHISDETKKQRIELMEQLLLYGYNVSPNNDKALSSILGSETATKTKAHAQIYLKMIAMQVLIYEIQEGGRTSFNTIEPNVWGAAWGDDPDAAHQVNSLYNRIIRPNGSDDPDNKETIYYYYKTIVEAARAGEGAVSPAPGFDKSSYVMTWDSLNKKYSVTVEGLGDCGKEGKWTTNNPKVTVTPDKDNSSVTLSSASSIKDATITCKYYRGNGVAPKNAQGEYDYSSVIFRYFRFSGSYADPMQDMLYGAGYKQYVKTLKVSTENSELLIKKVDADAKSVSGTKFTLTHSNVDLGYSVELDGNGSSKDLIYGGTYRVSETTTPEGYEKINDFNISINGDTHKITDCTGKKIDDAGTIVSCASNQVKVTYANSGAIELTIVNMPKNFRIVKVDKNGNQLKGASFEIRDKNNNLLRFTKGTDSNLFKYDTSGSITTLVDPDSSSYPIALLPEGEYKIIETAAPANYRLPADEASRTTLIKISARRELSVYDKTRKTYVPAGTGVVKVINYNADINIHKTGNGKPLAGVQFELYNSDKSVKLKANMVSAGVYTYYDDQSSLENSVYITNNTGDITIKNVPEGTYYFKEIATVEPYVLPGDVYVKVDVRVDENGVSINGNYALSTIEISNTPNSFNFYKRDPEGNSLSGGKYKLQKYNNNTKKYEDVKLAEVENDGTTYAANADVFKEDSVNGKIQFTLTKGVATFIDMQPATTYRIIETEAPEGFVKVGADETATVYIDEHGNASGLLVLIDPKLPDDDASAYAELIINIQTGKQRILYAAVIFVVFGAIAGLIVYNNKKKK